MKSKTELKWFLFVFLVVTQSANALSLDGEVSPGEAIDFAKSLYMGEYRGVVAPQDAELEGLRSQVDTQLEANPLDPVLWFLRGAITRRMLRQYNIEMDQMGLSREEALADKNYITLRDESVASYQKALEVDGRDDAARHLGALMLGIIESDVFSDTDMRVTSARRKIERWKTDKEFHERIEDGIPWDLEFHMYGRIVTAYVDEKRYDEALGVIDEMQERFGSHEPWAKEIEIGRERITRDKASLERQEEAPTTKEAQKPKAASPDVVQPQEKNALPSSNDAESSDRPLSILLLLAAVIGVVGLVFLWWKKRR